MPRKFESGAKKRADKKRREVLENKGKRTLYDLGWAKSPEDETLSQLNDNNDSLNVEECTEETPENSGASSESFGATVDEISGLLGRLERNEEPSQVVDDSVVVESRVEKVLGAVATKHSDDVESNQIRYTNDPGTRLKSSTLRKSLDDIIKCGPPVAPLAFPRDSAKRGFPLEIFFRVLPNGEKICRDWLVWSETSQGLFCFSCCLFSFAREASLPPNPSELCKPDIGITDHWHKLNEKMKSPERSAMHIDYYFQWKSNLACQTRKSSSESQLGKLVDSEREKWRDILKCCLDVALVLAQRGLAFRGSSEQVGNPDNGNFLGILELIGKHKMTLRRHLEEVLENQGRKSSMQAHYLSWRTQNEFVQLCADHARTTVITEIKDTQYYTVIIDGTPDVSHTEQITFLFRFVSRRPQDNSWEVRERFLKLVNFENKKEAVLEGLVHDVLQDSSLDFMLCRGQSYDNGSNMSGTYKGVQARLLRKNPSALYSPCSANSLNLCGVNAAQSCLEIKSYFGKVQKLYNLFSWTGEITA